MKNGDKKATYAFDVFTYRVKKYIGAYAAAMGGLDAVVFTGGIGENSTDVRESVVRGDGVLRHRLDEARNESKEKEKVISADGARTAVLVIPTNEELVIAMDTMQIVNEMKREPVPAQA